MEKLELKEHKEVLRTLVQGFSNTESKQWDLIRNNILMYKNRVLMKRWIDDEVITLDDIEKLTELLFYTNMGELK